MRCRPVLVTALLALALVAPAAPAAAHPSGALEPTLPDDLSYESTDNVEYLGRFPEHSGTAGGAPSRDRKRFYLTDPRGVYVYDTTKPEDPTLLGSLPLLQVETGVVLAQEDPDTDDKILLVDGVSPGQRTPALHVVDVSDPAALRVLSTVAVMDHTWTCISGTTSKGARSSCAYAYGRSGHIVDLRDPAKARLLEQTWRKSVGYGDRSNRPYTHDLTEIRPGLVMSAGASAILMDTSNPAKPLRLTAIDQAERFPFLGFHSVEWAAGGASPWLVLGTEIAPGPRGVAAGSDCKGDDSVIETWDARAVAKALRSYKPGTGAKGLRGARFTKVDAFDAASRGLYLSGAAPGNVLYCAHWMELHPDFRGSGLMAVSYYDRGTRFVDIGRDGKMKEIGWIAAAEGYSGSPQWISDDVVYVMDYRRGLEVVRLLDKPATGVQRSAADVIAQGSVQVPPGVGSAPVPVGRAGVLGGATAMLLLSMVAIRRRASVALAAAV